MKTATLFLALLFGVHAAQAAEVTMDEQTQAPTAEDTAKVSEKQISPLELELRKRRQPVQAQTAQGQTTVAVVQLKQVAPIRLEPLADPIERYRGGIADSNGDVRNADPGYEYTYILPGDYSDAALQAHRQALVDEGYVARTGPYAGEKPGTEYVPGKGDVEIWRRPEAVANAAHLDRLVTCVQSPDWFRQYLRHERSQLPEAVKFAARVFHGYEPPPVGRSKPTEAQLRSLIFKHVQPHPGTPKKKLVDWG